MANQTKKVNKKVLFLSLLMTAIILPAVAFGQSTGAYGDASTIAGHVKDLAVKIGSTIVVIGFVISGILYLTAAGAPEKIKTAKGALIASVIGTVLIALAVGGEAVIKGIVDSAMKSGT